MPKESTLDAIHSLDNKLDDFITKQSRWSGTVDEKLTTVSNQTKDLHKKVIAGNGNPPMLVTVSAHEARLKTLESKNQQRHNRSWDVKLAIITAALSVVVMTITLIINLD